MRRITVLTSIISTCTIALCLISSLPGVSGVTGSGITPSTSGPWNFGSNWRFTWHIDVAESQFDVDTQLRFFVNTTDPVIEGGEIQNWDLRGIVSRLIDFGSGPQWIEMKGDALIARHTPGLNQYEFFSDSFIYDILFTPALFQDSMIWFKSAYTYLDPGDWDISTNETARMYLATNKTNANHVVNMTFSPEGALSKIIRTSTNGTISYQMTLIEAKHIGFDFESLYLVLGFTALGAGAFLVMLAINKVKTSRRQRVKTEMKIRRKLEREQHLHEGNEDASMKGEIHGADDIFEDDDDEAGSTGAVAPSKSRSRLIMYRWLSLASLAAIILSMIIFLATWDAILFINMFVISAIFGVIFIILMFKMETRS
ncbi:MAG: hypothetical protein ACTSU9_02255 [Promethearchaeota archaeon]